jgi:hypothetical protein
MRALSPKASVLVRPQRRLGVSVISLHLHGRHQPCQTRRFVPFAQLAAGTRTQTAEWRGAALVISELSPGIRVDTFDHHVGGSPALRKSEHQRVVDCILQILFGPQVAFRRQDRLMPEQQLNLLQFRALRPTEIRRCPPQIMRRQFAAPDLRCALTHELPHRALGQRVLAHSAVREHAVELLKAGMDLA